MNQLLNGLAAFLFAWFQLLAQYGLLPATPQPTPPQSPTATRTVAPAWTPTDQIPATATPVPASPTWSP